MRGQVAIEYLSVVILILLLLIPIWYQVSSSTSRNSLVVRMASARFAAVKIAETADSVYFQGPPARVTLTVRVPDGTNAITIDGNEVSFSVASFGGDSTVFAESIPPISGSLSVTPGLHSVVVEAQTNGVVITEA